MNEDLKIKQAANEVVCEFIDIISNDSKEREEFMMSIIQLQAQERKQRDKHRLIGYVVSLVVAVGGFLVYAIILT